MSRFLSAFLAALFIAGSAGAQGQLIQPIVAASPNYVGPIDVVASPTALYSLRAGSAAIAAAGTQSIVDLRRASDNATCTAKIATNGSVDLTVGTPCNSNTQTVTAWIGASSALVTKWYDQSGNTKDASQGTAANQPQLVLSASGGRPGVLGAVSQVMLATISSVAQPYSTSSVVMRTGGFALYGNVIATTTFSVAFNNTANTMFIYSGALLTKTAADSAMHALQGVYFGVSSVIAIDGSETTGSAGTNATGTGLSLAANPDGSGGITGYIFETGLWPSTFSAGNRTAMNANQHAYYGF